MSKTIFVERALLTLGIMSIIVSAFVLAFGVLTARAELKSEKDLADLHRDLDGFITKEES